VSRDIIWAFLNNNFNVYSLEKACILQNEEFKSQRGKGGGPSQCQQRTHEEGGGGKNMPKKCHVLFEWPINNVKIIPLLCQSGKKILLMIFRQDDILYFDYIGHYDIITLL
jgi:hypothetical protein